ncbi:hypothetical protein GDO86_015199 [Hymenochirus boettgeri]|uniref:Uncharacterized protein n=1 Tax=Hymenochirus boettgeri TaxID=247094 RepID=A0A8T2K0A5_9PIPI|nr:hypothetical protein GDO86_015199 [Hymenochirus boettgeri]
MYSLNTASCWIKYDMYKLAIKTCEESFNAINKICELLSIEICKISMDTGKRYIRICLTEYCSPKLCQKPSTQKCNDVLEPISMFSFFLESILLTASNAENVIIKLFPPAL